MAASMEDEINRLRAELREKNRVIDEFKTNNHDLNIKPVSAEYKLPIIPSREKLDNASIARYGRQLILPDFGVKGQLALVNSSVLVVGGGGLGCPVSLYLAAAGVGQLGIIDFDEVELNNLHRQISHSERKLGVAKCVSAAQACQELNSSVVCIPYHLALNSQNAISIIQQYDVIVDATDNVATRYLLNDACVLASKPLVSGSALRFEGQLTVYNHAGGPCYRCLYPKPPPPETVTNCSDGGVLGVVPGVIGNLQALEVIKILTRIGTVLSQKILLFDGLEGVFRTIRLRPKQDSCCVCGNAPTITRLIDYEQFCGSNATDKTKTIDLLVKNERITVKEYEAILQNRDEHVLIDVRQPVELEICQLPNAINIPIDTISKDVSINKIKEAVSSSRDHSNLPVYVVCKQGNDSQRAVRAIHDQFQDVKVTVKDIQGGLMAWARHVDSTFPFY